jgi:ubiquinone/menaquinone biosynthesis C-methylase UbiE
MLASIYDVVMMPSERRGLRKQRVRMCRLPPGLVLEIGVGTGLNLPHYERADLVVGVDPDLAMLRRADRRRHEAIVPVRLVQADARDLPFADGMFATVVVGLALCTIPQPAHALTEIHRVAGDGAELHFLEHVRSPRAAFGKLEDVIAPAWRRIAGGCRPNQDTVELIESSGWDITSMWRSRHGGLVQGSAARQPDT